MNPASIDRRHHHPLAGTRLVMLYVAVVAGGVAAASYLEAMVR